MKELLLLNVGKEEATGGEALHTSLEHTMVVVVVGGAGEGGGEEVPIVAVAMVTLIMVMLNEYITM